MHAYGTTLPRLWYESTQQRGTDPGTHLGSRTVSSRARFRAPVVTAAAGFVARARDRLHSQARAVVGLLLSAPVSLVQTRRAALPGCLSLVLALAVPFGFVSTKASSSAETVVDAFVSTAKGRTFAAVLFVLNLVVRVRQYCLRSGTRLVPGCMLLHALAIQNPVPV